MTYLLSIYQIITPINNNTFFMTYLLSIYQLFVFVGKGTKFIDILQALSIQSGS